VTPVLDASVFIAAISPTERHHPRARQLFESQPDFEPFLVPALFRIQVVSALCRRGESAALVETVDAIVRGPRFHARPLDGALLERSVEVARVARLRAYDAVYVALALLADTPLLTLDAEVVERCSARFAELRVLRA